jgi:hypothetical protein
MQPFELVFTLTFFLLFYTGLPDAASIEAASLVEPDNDRTVLIDASTAFRVDPDWTYGFPGKLSHMTCMYVLFAFLVWGYIPLMERFFFCLFVFTPSRIKQGTKGGPEIKQENCKPRLLSHWIHLLDSPLGRSGDNSKRNSPHCECHFRILGWWKATHGDLRER